MQRNSLSFSDICRHHHQNKCNMCTIVFWKISRQKRELELKWEKKHKPDNVPVLTEEIKSNKVNYVYEGQTWNDENKQKKTTKVSI